MASSAPLDLRLLAAADRALGRVAPGLVAAWAWGLWRKTRRFPVKPRERQWLDSAQRPPFRYLDKPLAVYVWGTSGPTVMLVHGWNGHAGQMGAFAAPLVQAGCRVVAFDAPGHGASPGRHTDIYAYTGAIDALAERYGPLQGLVAHSFGAVCAAVSLRVGLVCRRAALVGAPAGYRDLVDGFLGGMGFGPTVQAAFYARMFQDYGADAWSRFSLEENLARAANTRGLVVHDREDRVVPYGHARALCQAWPGARLATSAGLGHHRVLRDPEVVGTVIDFIGGEG